MFHYYRLGWVIVVGSGAVVVRVSVDLCLVANVSLAGCCCSGTNTGIVRETPFLVRGDYHKVLF